MTGHGAWIPDPEQRTALNAALRKHGAPTGFWNDRGEVAPWPDDIDEWRPSSSEPITTEPGQQTF